MKPTPMLCWLRATALAFGLVSAPAFAGTATLSVALDTDNNAATGCTVPTANGPVAGIELVLTTAIGTTVNGASVTRLERQTCVNGVLGAPVTYDNGGWDVGLGNGTGGKAVVETSFPLALLPPGATVRAVAMASDGAGGQDATAPFTFTLLPVAGPTPVVAVPLSPWLLLPLALGLFALTAWLRTRYPGPAALVVVMVVFTASGLAWAATVLRDGNIGDWSGIAPAVSDTAGDGTANADIVAVFVQQDGTNLYFRIDADIRKDAAANQQPTVNAGTNQAITLPAGASLSGTATDDGLPNPPGALTLTWTKFSGPGNVSFGNAALAATTATFSAPGTYVLRLSAFDGALTGSGDVTITVNAGGGANQPPVVSAGANQAITLPNSATLAGTATDDGLPNPPSSLTTTWSFVSGPITGATFGDPGKPGTTATFSAPGTYVLRLTANDGALSASSTVQIDVADGAPTLVAIADRTINVGDRLQVLLEGKDGNGNDILTFALPTAPAGASLNPAPLIDWVPTPAQVGTHPFTAKVTDSGGKSATVSFNVTVVLDNHPPALAPQASLSMPAGTAFARTLSATDPDAGDTLTFALVLGPNGMTLTGADLAWSTSGRNPGDYAVTVKVTDSHGASDQKTFTLTLIAAPPAPVAKDDNYKVKVSATLTVPAPGVLGNDIHAGAGPLAATKLTDPGVGTLSAFSADGSFTYQAPATPPGVPFTTAKVWSAGVGSDRYRELVADLNADGYPDIVSFDNNGGIRARSGLDGSQLWSADRTGATDCALNSGQGSMDNRVLADLDDSGRPSLAQTTFCSREGSNWQDSIVAFDHLGKVKWVSPPLSKPHPDIARGATPPPPGGFTPGGLAFGSGLSAARLTAGGPPVLLMRQEIPRDWPYTLYYDAGGAFHYAGCRAATGLPADENVACRVTFVISGTDGSVLQTLVVRNPAVTDTYYGSGPNSLKNMPPIAMDIDGDGRVDLVSGTEVWMQNAGGGFDFAWQLPTSVSDTAVADLDGDGKAEIIHVRASGFAEDLRGIFIYGHDGPFRRRIPLGAFWITPLTIADVDGDGRSDIVIGGDGTIYAFRDDGRPIWAYVVPQDVPDNPVFAPYYVVPTQNSQVANAAPQVYDLDGDGVAEVVFSAYSRIMILDGRTGRRKVDPYWTYEFSYHDISALMLVDMNNDGHVDIVQNAPFLFNCLFVGANFLQECINLIGPTVLSGGGSNNWMPGPKAFPHVQYRSTAIDSKARVLHDTKVSRVFRTPEQQGTVGDPRLAQATSFTYDASNAQGTSAPATVFIDIVPDNQPPVFTSIPPTSVWQHFSPTPPYALVTSYYNVAAFDPDAGDTITFSLKAAPSWVTLSGPTQIRFEPTCGSYGYPCPWGQTTVVVTATDNHGASTDQIFIVNLTTTSVTVPNVAGLSLAAAQTTLVAAGLQGVEWAEEFNLQPAGTVLAQEAAAGAVVGQFDDIRLTVSTGPQPVAMPFVVGMQLATANGILTSHGLKVNVSTTFSNTIPAGEVMGQSPAANTLLQPAAAPPVDLTVSAGGPLPAPIASIVLQPGPGPFARLVGEDQQFKAVALLTDGTSADVTVTAVWSTTNAAAATVNVAGFVHAKASGSATITATLSGKSGSATVNVSPLVPGDVTAPTAAITSPADGADVTGPVPVVGTASDANFLRYELAMAGDDTWTLLAEGTSAVSNGTLGSFDPATLVNDQYTLRLTVFDKGENESVATTTVQLKGERKVGLFTMTFQDLNIPAAGIPLTVHRTYDSRDKAKGDFGIGWRLGLQTLRLRANRVLGTGWVRTVAGPTVSLNPTSEHKVSVTMPDGHVEVFDMIVSPTSNLGSLDFTTVTGFQPRPGTLGKLQALANNSLLIVNGGAEDELVDDSTLDTYSPKLYRYTGVDGTQMEISPAEGVKKVTDPNGNAITFGPGGILHSDGRGILFTRDAKDRIVAITDLLGNTQTYAYDGNGDLVSHTNAVGGISRYTYNGHHGLIEFRNALGTRVTRNEYDATGRLIAMTDADGKQITFAHNEAANEDVVTDRLGNQSRLVYDAMGNITRKEAVATIEGMLVNVVTTATFDALGNETTNIDPDGRKTAATYSGILPLTSVLDPAGLNLTTAFTYNARNDITKVTDAAGRPFTFTYDASGNLTGIDLPSSGIVSVVNNAQGDPVEHQHADGTRTVLTRDAEGRIIREEVFTAAAVLLRRTDTTWDANGNKASETLHRTIDGTLTPLTTQFTYDAANRLVAVTDPLGGVSRIEYDANGQLTAQVDALGRRLTFTYDTLGRRTRTTHPDGTFESSTFDAEGNEIATTDRAGRTMTHVYDELRRRVKTTEPDGSSTQTIYTPGGRVSAIIDARGNRTDYTYDAVGRLLSTTLPPVANGPGGPVVRPQLSTTYNPLGAPLARIDPIGRTTTFQYDANGRLVKTTYPDGSTTQQTWDARGRRTSVTNEDGQATNFSYDGLDRLISVAGLAGDATYTYDEAGNVLTQTDALGRVSALRYDALNRLVERRYPGGESEMFAYDAVGNTISRTDGLGRGTTMTFDAMNRQTKRTLPGGTVVTYAYAADGQRASVTDARGTTTYAYDSRGRVASITHPSGEIVNYAHDGNGNVVSISARSGTLAYVYDPLDRLTQVTAPEGVTLVAYDPIGNRVRKTAANGIVTDAVFDQRNRPTLVSHKSGGGATFQSYAMVYSPSGRATRATEFDGSVENFVYDSRGRLTSEVRTGSNPYTITHSYDAAGNRLQTSRNGAPTTFTYDIDNRLVSDGAATYAWDANGNLLSKTQGGVATQYAFDTQNRLVSILGGGIAEQYVYDDDGNRVMANGPSGITRFLTATSNPTGFPQVLDERDGGGTLKVRYSYGSELLGMQVGGTARTRLPDALGNTRSLADAGGTVTDRYQFDGYGNTVIASGATANPYLYRGERFDADTGLYQLRARYYSPSSGRFLSRDPFAGRLEAPVSLHRYMYANDDPIGNVDPSGRESLASLTVAQSISNTIKLAETASKTNQACNAFTTLGTIGYVVMASELAYGFATAWFDGIGSFKTSLSIIGFNPAPLKGTDIKSADIRLEPGPKLKLAFAMKDGTGQAGSLGPDGFNVSYSGPIKVGPYTLKKEIKKCETIPVGAVQLKRTVTNWMGINTPTIIPALSIEVELLKVIRNEWKLFDGISVNIQSMTGF